MPIGHPTNFSTCLSQLNNLSATAQRLKAIADIGLLYSTDGYNLERYDEIKEIAVQIFEQELHFSTDDRARLSVKVDNYVTPKVDVRAVVVYQNKLLMVQEKADNGYTVPGGWADAGLSPSEVAIKECFEETGLHVSAHRVLAIIDKKAFEHPPALYATYKIFIECRLTEANAPELKPGHDILDAAFIDPDAIPPLSLERFTPNQLQLLLKQLANPDAPTIFN